MDFVTSTEKILNGKLRFLSSGANELALILNWLLNGKSGLTQTVQEIRKRGNRSHSNMFFQWDSSRKSLIPKKSFNIS